MPQQAQETQLVEVGSWSEFEHRHDGLAEIRVRHAKDGNFETFLSTVKNVLDLPGIDIQAAGYDEVFGSSEETNTT